MPLTLDEIELILGEETFALFSQKIKVELGKLLASGDFLLNYDLIYGLFGEGDEDLGQGDGSILSLTKSFSQDALNTEENITLFNILEGDEPTIKSVFDNIPPEENTYNADMVQSIVLLARIYVDVVKPEISYFLNEIKYNLAKQELNDAANKHIHGLNHTEGQRRVGFKAKLEKALDINLELSDLTPLQREFFFALKSVDKFLDFFIKLLNVISLKNLAALPEDGFIKFAFFGDSEPLLAYLKYESFAWNDLASLDYAKIHLLLSESMALLDLIKDKFTVKNLFSLNIPELLVLLKKPGSPEATAIFDRFSTKKEEATSSMSPQ